MNELNPTTPVKPITSSSREAAQLNALVGFLNDPRVTGAAVPEGAVTSAAAAAAPQLVDTRLRDVDGEPTRPETKVTPPSKIFFTGRLKAGKDHLAEKMGAKVMGFADPIYAIQSFFFGTRDKTVPGARAFLQTVGQWGRGEVSAKYPLTPARAIFTHLIQNLGSRDGAFGHPEVDWVNFGLDENIWLDGLFGREIEEAQSAPRLVITNVRFENEYKRLTANGWSHYHILCAPSTWAKRLAGSGLTEKSPEVNDLSEKLAVHLDADVQRKMRSGTGMLRAVWCDDEVMCPSRRVHTIESFLQGIAIDETPNE